MLAVFWLVMASWYYCWRLEFTSLPGGIIGSMFAYYRLGFQTASYADVVLPCVCDCSKTLASEQRGWKKRQLPARCWSATLGNWKRRLQNTLKKLWRSWFPCSSSTSTMVSFGTWGRVGGGGGGGSNGQRRLCFRVWEQRLTYSKLFSPVKYRCVDNRSLHWSKNSKCHTGSFLSKIQVWTANHCTDQRAASDTQAPACLRCRCEQPITALIREQQATHKLLPPLK